MTMSSGNEKAIRDETKDGTPEQFEVKISELFDLAHNSVIMISDFYPDFYNRQKVTRSILSAAERVYSFRALIDSPVNVSELRSAVPWLFSNPKIQVGRSDTPVLHWINVDNQHFRFEEYHEPGTPGKNNLIIKYAHRDVELRPYLDEVVIKMNAMWEGREPIE